MLHKNKREKLYRFHRSARNLLVVFNIILPVVLIDCYCAPGEKYTRSIRVHHSKNIQQDKNGFTIESFNWDNSDYEWSNQNEDKRKKKYGKYPKGRFSKQVRRRGTKKTWKRKTKKRRKAYRTAKRRTKYYRVRKGDCLVSIARKFGISLKRLRKANSIRGSKILIGKRLNIPPKYKSKAASKVRTGRIARRYKSPGFIWPIKKIYKIKRDGQKGVKTIGVFIITKTGARVRAAATGIIKKIGIMRGYGKYIIVKHKNRYLSVYSNLRKIYVSEGQRVKKERALGRLRGNCNKLHFLINCAGKVKDPRCLIKSKSF